MLRKIIIPIILISTLSAGIVVYAQETDQVDQVTTELEDSGTGDEGAEATDSDPDQDELSTVAENQIEQSTDTQSESCDLVAQNIQTRINMYIAVGDSYKFRTRKSIENIKQASIRLNQLGLQTPILDQSIVQIQDSYNAINAGLGNVITGLEDLAAANCTYSDSDYNSYQTQVVDNIVKIRTNVEFIQDTLVDVQTRIEEITQIINDK